MRATEALPKVAGLKVKRSGTRSMPPEQLANWKGQSKPMTVDIDTVARVSPNSIPTFAPAAQLARHLSSASFSEGQRNEPSAEYHLLFAEHSDTALAGDGELMSRWSIFAQEAAILHRVDPAGSTTTVE